MRISDWSSDVCSSDLVAGRPVPAIRPQSCAVGGINELSRNPDLLGLTLDTALQHIADPEVSSDPPHIDGFALVDGGRIPGDDRSEEHTSELQSLMRISYAVFCLKKKNKNKYTTPID